MNSGSAGEVGSHNLELELNYPLVLPLVAVKNPVWLDPRIGINTDRLLMNAQQDVDQGHKEQEGHQHNDDKARTWFIHRRINSAAIRLKLQRPMKTS